MTDTERVALTVTLTESDYAKALKALASDRVRLARRILSLVAIACLAYVTYDLASRVQQGPWRPAFFAIIAVTAFELATRYAIRRAARSFVKKNPDKLGPNRHEIGPEGTSYQGAHGEGKSTWDAFYQIRETPEFFLLYVQSNFAQIVPKRCFANRNDIGLYREIVRKYYRGKMQLSQ